jgi:hypothetical protein
MKKFSEIIICTAFCCFSAFAFAQQDGTHEYRINGSVVEQRDFDALLSTLKQDAGTWFCAETKDGGITGYNAVDAQGTVYVCRFVSEEGRTKSSLSKKNKDMP